MSQKKKRSVRDTARKGDNSQPHFRLSLQLPPGPLRPERVVVALGNHGANDLDLLFQVVAATMEHLKLTFDERTISGAMASVVNRLSPEIRAMVVSHVVRGNTLYIVEGKVFMCKTCTKPYEQAGKHDVDDGVTCLGEAVEENIVDIHNGRFFEPLIEERTPEEEVEGQEKEEDEVTRAKRLGLVLPE